MVLLSGFVTSDIITHRPGWLMCCTHSQVPHNSPTHIVPPHPLTPPPHIRTHTSLPAPSLPPFVHQYYTASLPSCAGVSQGTKDRYYLGPDGRVLRTRMEAERKARQQEDQQAHSMARFHLLVDAAAADADTDSAGQPSGGAAVPQGSVSSGGRTRRAAATAAAAVAAAAAAHSGGSQGTAGGAASGAGSGRRAAHAAAGAMDPAAAAAAAAGGGGGSQLTGLLAQAASLQSSILGQQLQLSMLKQEVSGLGTVALACSASAAGCCASVSFARGGTKCKGWVGLGLRPIFGALASLVQVCASVA